MSWLKHILLGDFGQSHDIVETNKRVEVQNKTQLRQSSQMMGQHIEIARLKKRTEELNLALTALSRYLLEEKLINREKLVEFIEKIDLEDGLADGRLSYEDAPVKPKLIIPEKD